ncbi:MAG: hypothetical protein AB7O24_04255 [Kofleriaceae bacterium]
MLDRGPRGELVDLPVLGPAWLQLIGHADTQDVEADMYRRMKARGIELDAVTALSYEAERAALTLARAAKAPEDRKSPFGTIEEWGQVDSDTLSAIWQIWGDVRERLAPLDTALPQDQRDLIASAIAKKNSILLRSFGVSALATWLVTTELPLVISPEEKLSSGDSSSEC